MKIYKREWWKKIFAKNEKKPKVNSLKDIQAIIEFFEEIDFNVKGLLPEFKKLEELEKEREVGTGKIININLETQAEILDKILEKYEFFQNDVDITGLRVKRVADQFLKMINQANLRDLVREKKQDQKWKLMW